MVSEKKWLWYLDCIPLYHHVPLLDHHVVILSPWYPQYIPNCLIHSHLLSKSQAAKAGTMAWRHASLSAFTMWKWSAPGISTSTEDGLYYPCYGDIGDGPWDWVYLYNWIYIHHVYWLYHLVTPSWYPLAISLRLGRGISSMRISQWIKMDNTVTIYKIYSKLQKVEN